MGSEAAGMGSEVARLLEAVDFAARKHKDQRRKDPEGTPYINHPIGAETPRHRVPFPGDPRGPSLSEPCSPLGVLPTPGSPSPWSLERTVSLFPYHALQHNGGKSYRSTAALAPAPSLWLHVPATTLLACCGWGPLELLRDPCATTAPARPGDSTHLGGSASPCDLAACPAKGFVVQDVFVGFPCLRVILGKLYCPPCSAAPVSPTGAIVLAWSCLFPGASCHLSILAAGVARILAHEAGVTDIVVLQVTPCPALPVPFARPGALQSPSPPPRRRPPSCTTQWRTRTPRSPRSRSVSGQRCGAWWRR